jgi:hypothetical protein
MGVGDVQRKKQDHSRWAQARGSAEKEGFCAHDRLRHGLRGVSFGGVRIGCSRLDLTSRWPALSASSLIRKKRLTVLQRRIRLVAWDSRLSVDGQSVAVSMVLIRGRRNVLWLIFQRNP